MRFMFDTNICSYILKNRPASVKNHFDRVGSDALAISTVVLAELYYGAARHPQSITIRGEIDDFSSRLSVIPWDEIAADHYGVIRAFLEKSGSPIGAMEMMIAAQARSLDSILITNNTRHFEKVPGLKIENWA